MTFNAEQSSFNLFVYGTLRGLDKRLSGVKLVCRTRTQEDFFMFNLGYPCVFLKDIRLKAINPDLYPPGYPNDTFPPEHAAPVCGDVYLVPNKHRQWLDQYEGSPDYYRALPVKVKGLSRNCPVLMYYGANVLNNLETKHPVLPQDGVIIWSPLIRGYQ